MATQELASNAGQKKKRGGNNNPTGKGGFKKGETKDDPRHNNDGQRTPEAVNFGRGIRALLVSVGEEVTTLPDGRKITKIEGVVRAAYKQAIEGDAAARNFIVERVEGKITQPISGPDGLPIPIAIQFIPYVSPDTDNS